MSGKTRHSAEQIVNKLRDCLPAYGWIFVRQLLHCPLDAPRSVLSVDQWSTENDHRNDADCSHSRAPAPLIG
jgi:hypothetical protein